MERSEHVFAGLRNIFSISQDLKVCFLHLALFRFTSDVSLAWGPPLEVAKNWSNQSVFGQELGKKLSAFKIRFLKTRHPFEDFEGSHYKMISAVHVTTKWKDQNMIFAGLRNIFSINQDLKVCFLHLALFRFTSDVSLGCRSPLNAAKIWSNQNVFGQELGKKLSAFKIRFLKERHPFEDFEGSHYKMISAVHITRKCKDQKLICARKKTTT